MSSKRGSPIPVTRTDSVRQLIGLHGLGVIAWKRGSLLGKGGPYAICGTDREYRCERITMLLCILDTASILKKVDSLRSRFNTHALSPIASATREMSTTPASSSPAPTQTFGSS